MKSNAFRFTLPCVLAALASCVDQPNPIAPPAGGAPVDRLSQLGIFVGPLNQLQPAPGIVAYDVNVSLYSDGADKHRFLAVPSGTMLQSTSDRWVPPPGTYFIKNFFYPIDARDPDGGIQLIETRFLIQGDAGLTASTYVWNSEQTEAFASGGNLDVPVEWTDAAGVFHDQSFHVPGTSLCQSCHADRPLGIRTRQLSMSGAYPDGTTNQFDHLVAAGVLDAPPPDGGIVLVDPQGDAPLDARARSYLDVNCAECHAAGAEASGTGLFWDFEDTGPGQAPRCRAASEAIDGNRTILVPGAPAQSEFLSRMLSSDPFARMPQGPTRIPDGDDIAVLWQWVEQMTPPGCP